ncbi:MAG TPA: peptide-N4-asparagine amidase [Acidobacteriaceae bacterium]|nr:peptide-N4-asparagine amidase [Acidobacteriaceae bacterium]
MRKSAPSILRAGCYILLAALTCLPAGYLHAQVVPVSTTPQIGSSNPVTAAPLVPRPNTKPCVVQLFSNLAFENYTPATFSYTPPANCPGPWAKVVFTADFTVTAGIQYDRTAAFYLGHANIYYGTTSEPSPTLSPSWHVERDVTDLSAIFKSGQTGEANIGNTVNSTYTGIIYASAALEFYPASFKSPAPRVPDIVVPINGSGGDAGTLNTSSDTISQTLNLPTNVEQVYLDVVAQSQIGDEFWYLCVPNDQATNLETCGNTAFRETEVTIDGKPAGVAPVYPWIFTGGIDPFLWIPIPGNQALDFRPYRVDLTPFAGLLSDGETHTVAISVYNANYYFLATANLLVYTDHGSTHDAGGILTNTLSAAPSPNVDENISYNSTTQAYTGTIGVGSSRDFTISGWLNTSHGRVITTIHQNVNFLNTQTFDVSPLVEEQNAVQSSTVDSVTSTQQGPITTTSEQHFSYPLTVDYDFTYAPDYSTGTQVVSVNQQYLHDLSSGFFGHPVYISHVNEKTTASDTLNFNFVAGTYAPQGAKTTQTYQYNDNRGGCYNETLTAANNVLSNISKGCNNNHDGSGW